MSKLKEKCNLLVQFLSVMFLNRVVAESHYLKIEGSMVYPMDFGRVLTQYDHAIALFQCFR